MSIDERCFCGRILLSPRFSRGVCLYVQVDLQEYRRPNSKVLWPLRGSRRSDHQQEARNPDDLGNPQPRAQTLEVPRRPYKPRWDNLRSVRKRSVWGNWSEGQVWRNSRSQGAIRVLVRSGWLLRGLLDEAPWEQPWLESGDPRCLGSGQCFVASSQRSAYQWSKLKT